MANQDTDADKLKSKLTTLLVGAIMVICALTLGAIMAIIILRPGDSANAGHIMTIVGITAPILAALIALVQQQLHLQMNNRLSELLKVTEASSKAKGVLQEKERVENEPVLETESALTQPIGSVTTKPLNVILKGKISGTASPADPPAAT